MAALELKIPPPVVTLGVALLMWLVAQLGPWLHLPPTVRLTAAALLALAGIALAVSGIVAFRQASTTINPHKPHAASALVSSGVYRLTRNPMYLGLSFVLAAWAVYLGSAWAWLGPVLFVAFIQRFQIVPEERVLNERFGAAFASYTARVRRWL